MGYINQNIYTEKKFASSLFKISIILVLTLTSFLFILDLWYPRALIFFFVSGLSVTLFTYFGIKTNISRNHIQVLFGMLLLSLIYRVTPYINVINSGGDHLGILYKTTTILQNNSFDHLTGMYGEAVALHLLLGNAKLILGVNIFSTRFISIIVSAFIPVLIFLIMRKMHRDESALLGAVLSIPFILFLRTGMLLEPESLANTLFIFIVLLFTMIYFSGDKRLFPVLFLAGAIISTVHFFYALLGIAIVMFCTMILYSFEFAGVSKRDTPIIGILSISILIFTRIIWVDAGLYPFADHSSNLANISIPKNILSTFLPSQSGQEQALQSSTQAGQSIVSKVANFSQVCILGVFSFLSLITHQSQSSKYIFTFLISSAIITTTLLITFSSTGLRRGLRSYYMLSVFLLAIAALGMITLLRLYPKKSILSILLAVILVYSILGPLAPLGNNVDPRFGGQSVAVTNSDLEHLNTLRGSSQDGEVAETRIDRIRPRFGMVVPRFDPPEEKYISNRDCEKDSQIQTTGRFNVCST